MPDRTNTDAALTLLSEANQAHGTEFHLDHRFDGGVQSGAWLLIDGTGKQAVLKWSPNRGWAPQIERAARGVAKIRSAGYPTPAWLAVGLTANGFGYQIQELVPGRSRNQVTAHVAELLIDVLERHAGLDPDPQRCWSQFVTAQMTNQRDELLQRAAETGPTGKKLVAACERLLAVHGPVTLPTGDLVHGDFRPGNILFHANHVSGVIDIEALGSGTRAFDYATLLSAHEITPEAMEILCTAGEQVAGPGALAYCFAQVVLDLTVFVHERELQPGIQNVSRLLDRVVILLNRANGTQALAAPAPSRR
ncbi:aminoglycoside phosphotransferase family protein [Streptomyces sp. NPDC058690]|uniref:aminoglycoside phosphotransferase family protein n=1 Tax=Streptomyces sp. NPDC058690 TaxID=3346600 RepID=UPI00364E8653